VRENIKAFVGLDVHKDSIAIAYASADFSRAPQFVGTTGYSVIKSALIVMDVPHGLAAGDALPPALFVREARAAERFWDFF
jgi:hypothetical protein